MGSEAAGGQTAAGGGGVSAAASALNPATPAFVPSTSMATSGTASGHVHAGTVSAAEQLAATLGSTISVFNQFFGGYDILTFFFKILFS